jgi:hypothetical protein
MGRPRLYPLCNLCHKPVKPDQNSGTDTHKRCPVPRSLTTPAPVTPVPEPEAPAPEPVQAQDLSAKDVQQMIRDTVGIQDRYVIKYGGRWFLTDDPEMGMGGEGYDTPTALLAAFMRCVGFLRNGDGNVIANIR